MTERRLLLVGAGHAHLHLIEHATRLSAVGYDVTLVAPGRFDYSGVASAVAAGDQDPATGRIDVAALTDVLDHVEHVQSTVTDVDLTARTVTLADGSTRQWDVISFNIGSVASVPDELPLHDSVVHIKPLGSLTSLRERLLTRPHGRGHRVTVVGGGSSGLELAAHLGARADTDEVLLLEVGPRLGRALPSRARRRVIRLLRRRGVEVRTSARIHEITHDAVTLADGTSAPHDVAILATGLVPPALATRPPLGGPDGIPVRATLQHRDHVDVYAAGDCADFLPQRLGRIGVHGVRQGPVLLDALEARISGAPAPVYRPPRSALSILDLGGGTALATRGRWWWMGRSSLALKRWIDRRWIAGYQR